LSFGPLRKQFLSLTETDAISVKKATPQAVYCCVLQQREQGHGDEEYLPGSSAL
jgi:hypothetical protein